MVRDGRENEIDSINALRRQVAQLHAKGRPDWFRADFSKELADYVLPYLRREDNRRILVCERGGRLCGFCTIEYIDRQGSAFSLPRHYLHITEFGVDTACRRQGVGTELFDWLKAEARRTNCVDILLDMWEFNQEALKFYESVGMRTTRRYLSVDV